jgi:hypothetical protein
VAVQLRLSPASTKRQVASSVAAVFDPLGLSGPWLIRAKILLQSLWTAGGDWDDTLDSEHADAWTRIVQQAEDERTEFVLPRHAPFGSARRLLVYSDASRKAYAAALYMVADG